MRDLFDDIVKVIVAESSLTEEKAQAWILLREGATEFKTRHEEMDYAEIGLQYRRWYEDPTKYNYRCVQYSLYRIALEGESEEAVKVERELSEEVMSYR